MIKYIVKNNAMIGFVIGIIATIFAFYSYFYPKNSKADLKFFFQGSYNVVSTYWKVDSLSIFYQGRDVVKDSLNLMVERVKIINKGNEAVRLDDFGSEPLGIKILNCRIIHVQVPNVVGDDAYLRSTLKPQVIDSNHVHFQKTVFEPRKAVYIDLYILYRKGQDPDYYPIGKIVGQEILDIYYANEEKTMNFWDYAANVGLIVLVFVDIIGIPFILILLFFVIRSQMRKHSILKRFDYPLRELNDERIVLVKMYKAVGKRQFVDLLKDLLDYSHFYPEVKKARDAIALTNKLIKARSFSWFRAKIKLETPYSKVHSLLSDAEMIVRDNESNLPVALKESLVAEVRKTLQLFDIDADEIEKEIKEKYKEKTSEIKN